jgi:hypothetical protein
MAEKFKKLAKQVGRGARRGAVGALGAYALSQKAMAADSPTNMNIRLSLSDALGNPTNILYIDPLSSNNTAYITEYVRGGVGISPTKIANKFQTTYFGPEYVSPSNQGSNWVINGVTSKAFTSSGPLFGFDPQSSYNGDDVSATNAYLSVFATDTANNGFGYGPNPANFTNAPGLQLLTFQFNVNGFGVSQGTFTNLGIITTRTWNDEANKKRTMIWDNNPSYNNYQIVFTPEPNTLALGAAGATALGVFGNRKRRREDKSLAGRVNNHNCHKAHMQRGGQRRS